MVEPHKRPSKRTSIHNISALSMHSRSDSNKPLNVYEKQNIQVYTSDKVAGTGTFGVVYQTIIPETGEKVAIKKVFQDPRYKNRELELMKDLVHPNIVSLRHSFFMPGENPNELFLNLVMEYVPDTLYKVVRDYTKKHETMPSILVKLYSYQLLRGLGYCHLQGICHRDIKPQNLLVDPETHRLVLCDFGSAKRLVRGEPNIAYICSRYYRAPELILGASDYGPKVDVWSAGCVIAEMFLGEPLFPGESATDQIVEIIKVLGTPTKEETVEMNFRYNGSKLPDIRATPWARALKNTAPAPAVELISKLLTYSPSRRLTAFQALQDPFFDDLKRNGATLPDGKPLPQLFNWNEAERKYV
jgi:serine/threonine protein kinase